ncbi:hypothetical protein [Sphingomonas oryzagri]
MIRRIDYWIGRRLFHPPIIWICQRAGMTQWAVAAYAWLAATFTLVMRARFNQIGDIVFTVLVSLMALLQTVATALLPDMPRRPSFGWRSFVWIITAVNLLDLALRHGVARDVEWQWAVAWDVLALTAEYAKTITTIPPRKRREGRVAARRAFS